MGRLTSLLKRKPKTVELQGSAPKTDDTTERKVNLTPATGPPLSLSTSFLRGPGSGSHGISSDKQTGIYSTTITTVPLAHKVSLMDDIMEQLSTPSPSPDTPQPTINKPISGLSDFGLAMELSCQLDQDPSTRHDDIKALAANTAATAATAASKPPSCNGVAQGPLENAMITVLETQKDLQLAKKVDERAQTAVKLREASRKANAQLPSDDEGSDSDEADSDGESVPGFPRGQSVAPPFSEHFNGIPSGLQQHPHYPISPLHPSKLDSHRRDTAKKSRDTKLNKQSEPEPDPVTVLERMRDRHRAALAGNTNHPNHPCNREDQRGNNSTGEFGQVMPINPHQFNPALNAYSGQGMVPMEDFAPYTSYHSFAQQPPQQSLAGYSSHSYPSHKLQQLHQHQQHLHMQQQQLLLQQHQLQQHIQQHVDSRRDSTATSCLSGSLTGQTLHDAYQPSSASSYPGSDPNSIRSPPRPSTRQSTTSTAQLSEESWPSGDRPNHPRVSSQKSTDSGFGCSPEPDDEKQKHLHLRQATLSSPHGDVDAVAKIISNLCLSEDDDDDDDDEDDEDEDEGNETDEDDDSCDSDDGSEPRSRPSNRQPIPSPSRTEVASTTVVADTVSVASERDHDSDDGHSEDEEIPRKLTHSRRGSLQHGDIGGLPLKLHTDLLQQTNAALAAANMAVAVAAANAEGLDYALQQNQQQHQHYFHPHRYPPGAAGAYPTALSPTVPSPTTPTPGMHHHPSGTQPTAHPAYPTHHNHAQLSAYQFPLPQHPAATATMLSGHQHSYSLDRATGALASMQGGGSRSGYAAQVALIQQQQQQQAALRRAVSMRHPPTKSMHAVAAGQHRVTANRSPLKGFQQQQQQQHSPRQMRSRTTTESSKLSSGSSGPYIRGFADPLPSVVQQQQQQAAANHQYQKQLQQQQQLEQQGHSMSQTLHFPNHRMHPQQHPSPSKGHPSPLHYHAQQLLHQAVTSSQIQSRLQQQQQPHHVAATGMHHIAQPSIMQAGYYSAKGPVAAATVGGGQAHVGLTGVPSQFSYGGGGVVHPALAHSMELHHHAQPQAAGLQAMYQRRA
ncbi:hypothetical protein BGZ73_002551 [Actinomortierella ambigua]|nr:hypothetical protein BGZ73_002551 [Actinomortierella ambigua]